MGLLDQYAKFRDYIAANTPRSTRPVAKPGDVLREGLLDPNKFNAVAANRFKDSMFGLLGGIPGADAPVGFTQGADYFNRGEPVAGAVSVASGVLPFIPATAASMFAMHNVAEKIGTHLPAGPAKKQAGMIVGELGRIPENHADTNKLAAMLRRAGEAKGYEVIEEGSAVSPSMYVTFVNPVDDSLTRQVRLSNHADKYPELARGIRSSVDPSTGVTFEQAVNWLGREGFPTSLSTRYSNVPTWEEYYAQRALTSTKEATLQRLIDAWRNKPKATRGPMPTLDDI